MSDTQSRLEAIRNLRARLSAARRETDALFDLVKPDWLYERPIPERHRIIFYLGHLEAFDWNLLGKQFFGLKPFQETFDRLFAFGIDPVEGALPADKPAEWPSLERVRRYNSSVRQALDGRFDEADPSNRAEDPVSPDVLLNTAVEHRLMHAETLAYMLHQLPHDKKISIPALETHTTNPVAPAMVEVPGGTTTLGLPRSTGTFGWDNEYEAHTILLPAFEIDLYATTNGQYLQFVESGGYQDPAFWTADNWDWRQKQNVVHPVFWKRSGDSWLYRTMFGDFPFQRDWPVYTSHAEAAAYARWAGKKLPTEAQWQRAAYGSSLGHERPYPWGSAPPGPLHGNFDFRAWNPVSVNAFVLGRSSFGLTGLLGNGWEWTSTPFQPFPGFEPFSFYAGYSADFFDGTHYVMKGGSARTAACMLRSSFRNWFQPRYPYAYAGFRCVKD